MRHNKFDTLKITIQKKSTDNQLRTLKYVFSRFVISTKFNLTLHISFKMCTKFEDNKKRSINTKTSLREKKKQKTTNKKTKQNKTKTKNSIFFAVNISHNIAK